MTLSSSRRLGLALLVSFGLTIASFIVSTIVLRSVGHGISAAAESVATNASPSIEQLSHMSTLLRHMEVALDDYTDRIVFGHSLEERRASIDEDRRRLEIEWARHLAAPAYPGERELQPGVTNAMAITNRATDRVLTRIARGDGQGAERLLDEDAKPAIDLLDQRLHLLIAFNAREAAALGRRIVANRKWSLVLSFLLYTMCALFAAAAAGIATWLVHRYAKLMEYRVSELELFAGRVAHDIRSPLTSVGLALNLAERNPDLDPRTRTSVARGSQTLQRVAQVVDGLLMFARAGAVPSAGASADVKRVIEGVVDDIRPAADAKQIELHIGPIEPGQVACSPGVLASIVANLVGNAIKYMADVPVRHVALHVHQLDTQVRIEVHDTGPGIPADLLPRVFDPYVRAAQATIPGLGLGLATVRRLAEAHGGTVGAESRSGAGSLFWIELPKAR